METDVDTEGVREERVSIPATVEFGHDLRIALLIQSTDAVKLPNPKRNRMKGDPEEIAAYEITLKAILPESFLPLLFAVVKGHRVTAVIERPDDVVSR